MSFKVLTIDFLSEDAPKKFVRSLRDSGFAVLKNHPISGDLLKEVYKNWKDFFNSKEKHSYPFHEDKQDGYFPFQSENARGYKHKDLKEFYHIYPWGRYPLEINDKTKLFYEYTLELGRELLEWIDQCTPRHISKKFSVPLADMMEDSEQNLLRVINYPPIDNLNTHGAIRAQEHADINLITLLVAATEPGLQVKNTNGKWIDIKSNPGELIINTGDMLQECSDRYFPSTIHRVENPRGGRKHRARISMPVFIHPSDEIVLSEKHTSKSYLEERLREIGLKE
jgi:isopenicillin N synthase-like dioxygenase